MNIFKELSFKKIEQIEAAVRRHCANEAFDKMDSSILSLKSKNDEKINIDKALYEHSSMQR